MTLAAPEVRAAKAILAADRKAKRQARPARVVPVAEGQRQPRKRDPGFLAFLRRQPCAVGPVGCSGAVQAAHYRSGRPGAPTGLGIKPDDRLANPLCAEHHRQQHVMSEFRWWALRGIDPLANAAELHRRYLTQGDA